MAHCEDCYSEQGTRTYVPACSHDPNYNRMCCIKVVCLNACIVICPHCETEIPVKRNFKMVKQATSNEILDNADNAAYFPKTICPECKKDVECENQPRWNSDRPGEQDYEDEL